MNYIHIRFAFCAFSVCFDRKKEKLQRVLVHISINSSNLSHKIFSSTFKCKNAEPTRSAQHRFSTYFSEPRIRNISDEIATNFCRNWPLRFNSLQDLFSFCKKKSSVFIWFCPDRTPFNKSDYYSVSKEDVMSSVTCIILRGTRVQLEKWFTCSSGLNPFNYCNSSQCSVLLSFPSAII